MCKSLHPALINEIVAISLLIDNTCGCQAPDNWQSTLHRTEQSYFFKEVPALHRAQLPHYDAGDCSHGQGQKGKSGGQIERLTKHASKQRHAVLWQVLASLDCNHCNIPEDRAERGWVLPFGITDIEARPVQPEGCRADEDCQSSPQQLRSNHRPWVCHRLHKDDLQILLSEI